MKLTTLSIFCVLALLVGLLAMPHPATQVLASQGFSAIPLQPQVAADLKAQGKPGPELRFPNSVNHGRPFNPRDASPVGQLQTPSELKALVILVGSPTRRTPMTSRFSRTSSSRPSTTRRATR